MSYSNLGAIDRVVRVVAGTLLVSLVYVGPQTPLGWIGLILLLTGVVGFCPVYCPLGLSTCAVKKRDS